jgi:rubredoxin
MAANMGGSRMSCLKLHWPQTLSLYAPADGEWSSDSTGDDAPVILSFPRLSRRAARAPQRALLNRARTIHENRCCPVCGRAAVVPVDSERALMSRDHMPVPGTGMLLGFECDSCGHTWDA